MVWRTLTKEMLEETKQHFASLGYSTPWYEMAMEVILTTLGPEWWKQHCILGAARPDEFLAVTGDSEEGNYDHDDRVIKLGHMLYALRTCKVLRPSSRR